MCEVIKKKLNNKGIKYIERKDEGEYVLSNFHTDHFPVLKVGSEVFTSLTEIKNKVEAL